MRTIGWLVMVLVGLGGADGARAAVDGKQHAIVAPAFDGSDGNLSFIRFLNTGETAAQTFTVTIVGTPSGREYGTTTYSVPAHASPQEPLTSILAKAGAGALTGGDTGYSVYLQNSNIDSGFMHVTFNGGNQFFENQSNCQFFAGTQYLRLVGWLPNVHTTRLAAFPMRIYVHNFNNAQAAYRLTAYDAVTGTVIGNTVVTLAANETRTIQESALEQTLNFTPTASQFHINVRVEAADGGTYNGHASAAVFNTSLNALINMSTACKLRP